MTEPVTDTDRQALYITGISFISVITILCLIICTAASRQLCFKDYEMVSSLYRHLTLICIISSTISIIGDLIHLLIRWQDFPNAVYYTAVELLLLTTTDAIFFIGNATFYILLLARVHNAFRPNKYITIFLLIVIGICILTSISYLAITVYYNSEYFHVKDGLFEYLTHVKYAVYPLSISTTILDIGFFVVFIRQMRKVVVDIDINSVMYQNIHNVLIKQVVLFMPAIIKNQLFFGYLFYASYRVPELSTEKYIPYLVVAYMIRTFDISVNILVLWLVININHDKYICFCKYCHVWCTKCLSPANNKPLENPYQRL